MGEPFRRTESQTPDPERARRLIVYYDEAVESINILYEAAGAVPIPTCRNPMCWCMVVGFGDD
jgi:hypothetical protein